VTDEVDYFRVADNAGAIGKRCGVRQDPLQPRTRVREWFIYRATNRKRHSARNANGEIWIDRKAGTTDATSAQNPGASVTAGLHGFMS
jgi:hypothetical protein